MYDVVTLGETMLRLTPPNLLRIEQAHSFDYFVGGSESNVAVGLARLGLRVAWLSRLTNNPLGRHITNTIGGYGVDVAHMTWTESDRLGLYMLEEGRPPRGSRVIYDRAGSAFSNITPADLPIDLFTEGTASILHMSGISLAVSEHAAATAERAIELAKAAGWLVSFDINYRGKMWSAEDARLGCNVAASAADLLIAPLRDVSLLYGVSTTPVAAFEELGKQYPNATIVLTLGGEGATAHAPGGDIIRQPVFATEPVGRIGGGDSFVAGFLYGYLTTEGDLASALTWGAATAAFKYTMPGDMPIVDRDAVAELVAGGTSGVISR